MCATTGPGPCGGPPTMDLEAMRPRAIRTLALAMRRRFWRWCSSSDRIPKQIRLPVGTTTAVPGQQSVAPSPGHCGTYEVGWEEDDGAPFWCDGSRKRKEVKLYFEKEDQPPVKAKQCSPSLSHSTNTAVLWNCDDAARLTTTRGCT